jgi:predicted metal-dependent hydrolase
MSTAACDYDPLYLQGVAYFNACEFFEAHEVWEDLWKSYTGDLRLFYKGLIQAAVALHHFGNGNIRGARKVYRSSRGYLDAYRPVCVGLDLEDFGGRSDYFQPDGIHPTEAAQPVMLESVWKRLRPLLK